MLRPSCRLRLRQALYDARTTYSSNFTAHRKVPFRPFTSTQLVQSQIRSTPISIPAEVQFTIIPAPPAPSTRQVGRVASLRTVHIKGPLGELKMTVPDYLRIDYDQASKKASISVDDRNERKQREMWGTTRAYIQNHVLGVSEGHATILRLVGVGYRATVEPRAVTKEPEYPGQMFVSLKVGYSHPIELGLPQGVKATTPQPTKILLEGCEKEILNQFAAEIRKWRVPEPYKGKGIFVNNETIRLKAKKIK